MAIDPGAAKAEFDALPVMFQHHAMQAYHAMRDDQRRHEPIREQCRKYRQTVHHIHDLGEIQIVDYTEADSTTHEFAFWLNGENQHEYASSLDQALLLALCTKYGSNGAAYWVARMIGMVKPKEVSAS